MRKLAEVVKALLQVVTGRFTAVTREKVDNDMYSYHLVSSDRTKEEIIKTPKFMPLGEVVQMGNNKFYVVQRRLNTALDASFTRDYERVFFFLTNDKMWTQFEGSPKNLDLGMQIVETATYNIVERFQASTPADQRIHLEEYHAVFMAAQARTEWLS